MFDLNEQAEDLNGKLLISLLKLSDAVKASLWDTAKRYGLSPLQTQILIFINNHKPDLCTVNTIKDEFAVSQPTVSDAVNTLVKKELAKKQKSEADSRSFFLLITSAGNKLISELENYTAPFIKGIQQLDEKEKISSFTSLLSLLSNLNKQGLITPSRMCFHCKYYEGDTKQEHYCNLLNAPLQSTHLRIDCPDFERPT